MPLLLFRRPKRIEKMSPEELRKFMVKLGFRVEKMLPPGPNCRGKCLFFMGFTDDGGPGGPIHYLSNADMMDMAAELRRMAQWLEEQGAAEEGVSTDEDVSKGKGYNDANSQG